VGSDVREGKKTLIFSTLMASRGAGGAASPGTASSGTPGQRPRKSNPSATLAYSAEVRASIEAITRGLTEKALSAIEAITSGTEEDRAALRSLLDFTTARRQ